MKTTPATNTLRWLAALQQAKDTVTILGMNFMLLFGLMMGIAVPGLILYFLRWKLVRATGSPATAIRIWGWSLVHEFLCVILFASEGTQQELHGMATLLAYGYTLGIVVSMAGLVMSIEHRNAVQAAAE
ncbi:hypothetical protein [Hymenobacter rubripertinctus]|uniref:Uncharacterized protein n=1 Tax=Hymenobacter rubripertinctus TaxID=2029981 RepID=A0A418QUL5_9BACT|nr:hypothetical protein [Hymenobacter rubripertinctus]RIY08808.1 hypothetical protein D0T11_13840 [Hymenobacter rubripertinctus]